MAGQGKGSAREELCKRQDGRQIHGSEEAYLQTTLYPNKAQQQLSLPLHLDDDG